MKMASYPQPWHIRASAGRYVFRWDRLLDEGLAFFKRGFPRVPMTWRSARARANFKCDVADVNKQIRTDFRGVKCVSGECYQPCRENSSWYIRSDYLVQQKFNQSPSASYFNSLLAPATACESQTTACDRTSLNTNHARFSDKASLFTVPDLARSHGRGASWDIYWIRVLTVQQSWDNLEFVSENCDHDLRLHVTQSSIAWS